MLREYNEASIEGKLDTKWAGHPVHFAREIDSTNLWIRRLAKEGSTHGTLAVSEFQSQGRGRLGRRWVAPSGSCITMSLLLRPDFEPQYASMLTLVMGLSVAQAVAEMDLSVSIKWPNDVVVSHKKICGILTEMDLIGTEIQDVIVGVGINVNLQEVAEELKESATSLYLETGKIYDRNDVIAKVLKHFEENYDCFLKTLDLSLLKDEYHSLLANKDQPVRVLSKDPYEGIALGINDKGELLVQDQEGNVQEVYAGEVSVRGLYSYA